MLNIDEQRNDEKRIKENLIRDVFKRLQGDKLEIKLTRNFTLILITIIGNSRFKFTLKFKENSSIES